MSRLRRFFIKRWKQIAGVSALWLVAELAAVAWVFWQVGRHIG